MKFIIKYWVQLTGILMALAMIFGCLWKFKTRLDNYVNTQQQLVEWKTTAQAELDEHDNTLDEHHDDIHLLKDHDQLRLKGLLK